MTLIYSIVVSASATLFVGLALGLTFYFIRHGVEHEPLHDSYLSCDGGWHEAYLNECHLGLKRFPQQPINTYSNVAYIAAGVFVGQYFNTGPSHMFMVTMCFLGIGSALYHGLSVRWAGHLDVLAIYWVFLANLIHVVGLLTSASPALTTFLMFLGAGVIASFLRLVRKKTSMERKIAIILVPVYALEALYVARRGVANGYLLLGISLALFIFAFLVWILDKRKLFWPKGTGHGVWHLFTAAAMGLLFYVAGG